MATLNNRGSLWQRMRGHTISARAKPHFLFESNNKRFLYCYIRKNACTSFKRFICGESEHRYVAGRVSSEMEFMMHHHAAPYAVYPHTHFDASIFVYRDPIGRAISLFISKFVIGDGNSDIFENVRATTRRDPRVLTFNDFVTSYLSVDLRYLDPHCHSQASHLWYTVYTHAIPIYRLQTAMKKLIGDELTHRYFSNKVNCTPTKQYDDSVTRVPAGELQMRFACTGMVPSAKALTNDSLSAQLLRIYDDDVRMIGRLKH